MYSVVENCSLGHLENCRCQSKNRQKARSKPSETQENWHWGGCSDNVAFGDLVARHFVDALEGRRGGLKDERRAMNLHNNKVGRKVSQDAEEGTEYFNPEPAVAQDEYRKIRS